MEFLRLELNIAADTEISKWFELRMSDIMSQQSMIVRVSVVLRRTVCGKIDLRFTFPPERKSSSESDTELFCH